MPSRAFRSDNSRTAQALPRSAAAAARAALRANSIRLLAPASRHQSACFLKNAGISISSMPLLDSASTLAAALCERAVRQTLGVLRLL